MSSLNGLAYNDLISIRDLLHRAKTKTRQRTYRNHHLEASATTSRTPGQHAEQPDLNGESPTLPTAPVATSGVSDQHDYEAIFSPPIDEQASRHRSRSPRVNRTYSKKTTSDAQILLVEEPRQHCSQKKPCQRTYTSKESSAEQESGNDDDEHGVREERIRPRLGNPRRASTAPVEGLAVVKNIEKPRSPRLPSRIPKTKCPRTRTQVSGQRKWPKANETRKRIPLGRLRQASSKKTVRNTIDLKDFKFPSRPQTPDPIDFAAWTPGSGFDGIQPSTTSTTKQVKRRRQRVGFTSGELQPAAQHALKSSKIRVSEGSTPRRLFDVGDLQDGYHSLHDAKLLAGEATAEEARTSEEHHPLQVTAHEDRQTSDVGHIRSKHQESDIGRALAEALDKTRSSREGTPRTTEPSLPPDAPTHPYPSVPSDNAASNNEAGDAENTAYMDLPNAPAFFHNNGYPHPPSSALSSPPTHVTKPSSEPPPYNHRNLQIPSLYQPYPYPPSSAPPRPLPHQSEEESEDEMLEEANEATSTDPGSEQFNSEEMSFEDANEATDTNPDSEQLDSEELLFEEADEEAADANPTNPHTNSPPESPFSSDSILEETFYRVPTSPTWVFQSPGGYFATAIERLF